MSPSKLGNRLNNGRGSLGASGDLKALQPMRASKELPALGGLKNAPSNGGAEPPKELKKKKKKKKDRLRSSSKDGALSYPPVVVVSDEPLAVGAEVESRYGGGGDYFPGTVAGMNRGRRRLVLRRRVRGRGLRGGRQAPAHSYGGREAAACSRWARAARRGTTAASGATTA